MISITSAPQFTDLIEYMLIHIMKGLCSYWNC